MFNRITTNAQILGGQVCIRGMRFPVHQILDMIAADKTFDEILREYPYLEREDLKQAVEYGAWLSREQINSIPLNPTAS